MSQSLTQVEMRRLKTIQTYELKEAMEALVSV